PEAALLWVSKSQRHLSAALAELGFSAGQKLVGRLLKRLGFSLQANAKTREGTGHPDRNAQFEHINAEVKALGAWMPYRRARGLLAEFFPLGDDVPEVETIRQRTIHVGAR